MHSSILGDDFPNWRLKKKRKLLSKTRQDSLFETVFEINFVTHDRRNNSYKTGSCNKLKWKKGV